MSPLVSSIVFAVVIGLIVALIATGIMKGSLKSVHRQQSAAFYQDETGLQLTRKQDIFMYKKVDRVAKPKPQQQTGPRK